MVNEVPIFGVFRCPQLNYCLYRGVKDMPIVLDAMGSDDHPIPEIAAVIEFAKTTGEKVYFVGNRDIIFKHASESDFAGLDEIKSCIKSLTTKEGPGLISFTG